MYLDFGRLKQGEKMHKISKFLFFCEALDLNNGKILWPI